jgi:hypothetical protein
MRTPFVKMYLQKANNPEVADETTIKGETSEELLSVGKPEIVNAGGSSVESDKTENIWDLINGVWQFAFLVWIGYVITFGMLTGVALATDPDEIPYEWFSVLMITTFNVFDTIGRNLPQWIFPSPKVIWVLTFCRFIFWVTMILIASDDPAIPPP